MSTTEIAESRMIAPGAGDSLRVMGDLITFKLRARETGGVFTLFEGLVTPGGAEPIHAGVRIVMVSTEGQDADVQRAIAGGASAYVKKPFRGDSLLEVIATLEPRAA